MQFLDIPFFQYQKSIVLGVANNFKGFHTGKHLDYSGLEGFVFFVDFSEFLLSVVFDDVVHVNLSSFEEGLCLVWVSMVSDLYLLALEFELFGSCVF